ncbi:MAG: hypothetical protein AAGF95_15345 [Chloroflexota bacterium]
MREQILHIFNNDALDNEEVEDSKTALVEDLINDETWPAILAALIDFLENDQDYTYWDDTLDVLWGAACDNRAMPVDKVIALLYYRYDPTGTQEYNLVWSITAKLKNIRYHADYWPLDDPDVSKEFHKLA